MADNKLDYKKEYKDLYLPKEKPMFIKIPPINFIMVDGKGAPEGEEYQSALQILYSLSFTIKMAKGSNRPDGYFEYVVPPLEGLWWVKGDDFYSASRSEWLWTSMIRQPEFVTDSVFEWAVNESLKKKPGLEVKRARLQSFDEGTCVQIMHIGSYSDEKRSIDKILKYIDESGFVNLTGSVHKHHEIYLSDPKKTQTDKLKTVIRLPVKVK